MRRSILWVALAIAALVGVIVGYDMLVVTEEEELEAFVDAAHGEVTEERIDEALVFCDPAIEPVEVQVFGETQLYTDATALRTRARQSLHRFGGDDLTVLSSSVNAENGRGTIRLRFISSRGMLRADFTLIKHGDRWLVSKVGINR